LRVSGPDTQRLVQELLPHPARPRVARHLDYRDRSGRVVDDVVLTFFAGPHSYTGEDAAEVSCHGNPFIAQRILEDLFARGCRPAEPGEFTQRAFLNGRMDLSQAEAVMDVIRARSERALTAANQQLRGALGRRMKPLVDTLVGVLARVEAYIDFPDEDLPPEDRALVGQELAKLEAETNRLSATSRYGEVVRHGIKTVIVGEPNVGKSSLLNRLLGRDRALVSPEPGTTRDFIEEPLVVGPHCLRLIDTAGINPSPAPLERLGMEKTRERLGEADLVILVLDGSVNASMPAVVAALIAAHNPIIALNKSDLRDNGLYGRADLPSALPLSALTGTGMDELVAEIVRRADAFQIDAGDELIAINARHAQALATARTALAQARQKVNDTTAPELLASDLRAALSAYGEITGKVDNERMLDHLFGEFCIGK
jgi:tRNA modification GTPase